jgi:drug/metabolite transporter (DMT)-like permease
MNRSKGVAIGSYAIILVILLGSVNYYGYVVELISNFSVSSIFNYLGDYAWLILIISSILGALSYLAWYVSMKYLQVATAMSLNITYGSWIVLITSLPIFQQGISFRSLISALIIFAGTVLVVFGDAQMAKKKKILEDNT